MRETLLISSPLPFIYPPVTECERTERKGSLVIILCAYFAIRGCVNVTPWRLNLAVCYSSYNLVKTNVSFGVNEEVMVSGSTLSLTHLAPLALPHSSGPRLL